MDCIQPAPTSCDDGLLIRNDVAGADKAGSDLSQCAGLWTNALIDGIGPEQLISARLRRARETRTPVVGHDETIPVAIHPSRKRPKFSGGLLENLAQRWTKQLG